MAVLDAMPESEFQRHVMDALEGRGYRVWHVTDSRLMAAGLPDVVALKPGRLLLLELKREKRSRIRPEQQAFIDDAATVPGVVARIVKPSEWNALLEEIDR